jgi:hypothetical protein
MRLLLRHGFNTLNLNRIFLRVYETNLGHPFHEKVGFARIFVPGRVPGWAH